MEIKLIPGYTDYGITRNGDVFSKKKTSYWKSLRIQSYKNGYKYVRLSYSVSRSSNITIHRLVLMTFDRMPKKGEVCRHFPDNSKSNNHISNLKWGTVQENAHDRWNIHGTGAKNEDHPMCKISNKEIQEIRSLYATGDFSQRGLGRKYNTSNCNIWHIVNNKTRIL